MEESPFVELESKSPKSKRWVVVLEKIIAVLLIVFGLTLTISILVVLFTLYHKDYLPENSESGIIDFVINYAFQIIYSIVTVYAGVLLLFKKRLGWIFSMAIFSVAIVFIIYILYVSSGTSETKDLPFLIAASFFLILPCASFFFLTRKAMRQRYNIGNRDYGIAAAITAVLIVMQFNNYIW